MALLAALLLLVLYYLQLVERGLQAEQMVLLDQQLVRILET
jgi:hypothetical protein